MYRYSPQHSLEFFIIHPGGPYFKNKEEGAWSIPKGEIESGETELEAANREFREETGLEPKEPFIFLGTTRLKSGKQIHAWAFEGDWEGLLLCQRHVTIEWPPRSGKQISFPETDKAGFFKETEAKQKLHPAQAIFIERLIKQLS